MAQVSSGTCNVEPAKFSCALIFPEYFLFPSPVGQHALGQRTELPPLLLTSQHGHARERKGEGARQQK